MSTRIGIEELEAFKTTLETLNGIAAHVRAIEVKGHILYLGREQSTHYIVGIEEKKDQALNKTQPGTFRLGGGRA